MSIVQPAPRLLIGSSLLFWGAMTGHPLIGLACALVVEGCHWTRLRWNFDDAAYGRAWQLSTLLSAVVAALIWIEGSRLTALPNLLSWMPALLMPIQFVQSYGMRDSLPLAAFSFLARRHRLRAERLGLPYESRDFHFGNVMFLTCLVAACVGKDAGSVGFLPGLLVLGGWWLLGARVCRARVLLPALAVAGLGGFLGEYGIRWVEDQIGRGISGQRGKFDPSYTRTMIGSTGTVDLSPEIKWRLRVEKGAAPRLLRTAGFNVYLGNTWHAYRLPAKDFQDLESRIIGEEALYLVERSDPSATAAPRVMEPSTIPSLPSFTLRGPAAEGTPLPLPGSVAGMSRFELDGVEENSFGTVRVFPKDPVIDGTVYWSGTVQPELPPVEEEDLKIPLVDREAIRKLAAELQLDSRDELMTTLGKLQSWFHHEFKYTRRLTISDVRRDGNRTSPIARFLTEERAGHCEYFATGAALLLREAGIPVRYATGFAVVEPGRSRGEFIIRGTHGHAWCRVWDERNRRWIDFDPTPPDWLGGIATELPWMQRFEDRVQRIREDFFVWRNRPENQLIMTVVLGLLGVSLVAFTIMRLWKSKARVRHGAGSSGRGPIERVTPLHGLEPIVRRKVGPRPVGETFPAWVRRAVPEGPEWDGLLEEALQLHQAIRFDPAGPAPGATERLESLARDLGGCLRRRSSSV